MKNFKQYVTETYTIKYIFRGGVNSNLSRNQAARAIGKHTNTGPKGYKATVDPRGYANNPSILLKSKNMGKDSKGYVRWEFTFKNKADFNKFHKEYDGTVIK
jgi:hypothetical protein